MKARILFSVLGLLSIGLVSCVDQNDCICTATVSKKAAHRGASSTYPVYDWGSSCSSISQSDIPGLDDGMTYSIDCEDL